jgi:hypothetical protein
MSNHFNTAMEREESNFVEDKSSIVYKIINIRHTIAEKNVLVFFC